MGIITAAKRISSMMDLKTRTKILMILRDPMIITNILKRRNRSTTRKNITIRQIRVTSLKWLNSSVIAMPVNQISVE